MYAVIRTGGKQHKVSPGGFFRVEKLTGPVGSEVLFDEVLLVSNGDQIRVGQPVVAGAVVKAQIVDQGKAKKLTIFKKVRRHGYALKKGHRQQLTRVKIQEIVAGS